MESIELVKVAVLLSIVGVGIEAKGNTINFDDLTPGSATGDILAPQGVTFTSGSVNTEAVGVGDTIMLTFATNFFNVLSPQTPGAVSPPNYAISTTVARSDVLFSFSTAVSSAGLATDVELNETPQLVRLLALEATGTLNEFNVLALDEGFSDAVTAPDNLLSVDLAGVPFDYALFQVTGGGAEGFDDLTFAPVPIPAAAWLFPFGLVSGLAWIRRKRA